LKRKPLHGNFEGHLVSKTSNVVFRGKLCNALCQRKLSQALQFGTRNCITGLPHKPPLMWSMSFLAPGNVLVAFRGWIGSVANIAARYTGNVLAVPLLTPAFNRRGLIGPKSVVQTA
jgi:hypothetical protein